MEPVEVKFSEEYLKSSFRRRLRELSSETNHLLISGPGTISGGVPYLNYVMFDNREEILKSFPNLQTITLQKGHIRFFSPLSMYDALMELLHCIYQLNRLDIRNASLLFFPCIRLLPFFLPMKVVDVQEISLLTNSGWRFGQKQYFFDEVEKQCQDIPGDKRQSLADCFNKKVFILSRDDSENVISE